jgi:hypothetical protein
MSSVDDYLYTTCHRLVLSQPRLKLRRNYRDDDENLIHESDIPISTCRQAAPDEEFIITASFKFQVFEKSYQRQIH